MSNADFFCANISTCWVAASKRRHSCLRFVSWAGQRIYNQTMPIQTKYTYFAFKEHWLKEKALFNQHYQLISDMGSRIGIDSGMVVVIFISLMYLTIVFGMLFYVKNDWCDLLFKNFTESIIKNMSISMFPISDNFEYVSSFF